MRRLCIAVLLIGVLASTGVHAQQTMRVRGTIGGTDGNVLLVKERDGRDLRLNLPENVSVAVAKTVAFEEIKPGDYVGATTLPAADGNVVAVEVHYLPPTVPEGQLQWDLRPGSTMTNANVASVVTTVGRRELTLQYKGVTQKITVPEGTPLVRTVPGARTDLVAGEYIFTVAQVAPDGTLSASRIQVSKDGVKPPL